MTNMIELEADEQDGWGLRVIAHIEVRLATGNCVRQPSDEEREFMARIKDLSLLTRGQQDAVMELEDALFGPVWL